MKVSRLRKQVYEFMYAFGQKIRAYPQVPPENETRLRARLVTEETFELLEAIFDSKKIYDLKQATLEACSTEGLEVDVVEVADALADIDYVVEGTRLSFGINGRPIADEVHRSNMSKVGGHTDEHGKYRKPTGWIPPEVGECLRKQYHRHVKLLERKEAGG